MITLADVQRAAVELGDGPETPSVKLAIWGALLSAQTDIRTNCEQVRRLRRWVKSGLPRDPDKVYKALKGTGNFTRMKCGGLYWAEHLERTGQLKGLEDIGTGWDAQHDWRLKVYALMHGHGMAWKTVSMAAFILDPMRCELVPIDSHHCARFGLKETYPRSRKNYLAVERMIWLERDLAGCADLNLASFAWIKWEERRQATGASQAVTGCESHAGLNCRTY